MGAVRESEDQVLWGFFVCCMFCHGLGRINSGSAHQKLWTKPRASVEGEEVQAACPARLAGVKILQREGHGEAPM
jgi:hypothetical protein